jgi:fumarylacetoacetase
MNDATHHTAPLLRSWIASANVPDCDFPIQNLPFGAFTTADNRKARIGVAIGDRILDLAALESAGAIRLRGTDGPVFDSPTLNAFMALGRPVWQALRAQLSALLGADNETLRDNAALRERVLTAQADATMLLPVQIGGYTDFYSSREHATNVGSMFRDPANALLPNWLEMPIAYNGRASSVVISGTPVHRPLGQYKLPDQPRPSFGPCRKLDFELETGLIVGVGNPLGWPITTADAQRHIFGMVLLNDWSARDIQAWEYVPLGPFNAKTFATTISPWVVTMDALEPFRVAGPVQEPEPLPYLRHAGAHHVDIRLEVRLQPASTSATAAPADVICHTNFRHMYWSMGQQLAHHTISGCNTLPGDLMGSGTISGTAPDAFGSLLEISWNGKNPLTLSGGVQRTFLEDGDTLTLSGWAQGDGYRIGFGACVGTILPALNAARHVDR